jgi:hypothetical protein
MEEMIYRNTFAHRGNRYVIQIVNRSGAHYVTCTLGEEKFRDILIPEEPVLDSENFSAAVVFKEVIEAEERWIADNR